MDEERRNLGRPQTYTQESQFYAQELEMRRHMREEERKREAAGKETAGAAGRRRADHKKEEPSGRRREQENTQKIQILSVILGILVVLLIVAIIYEIILGHGLAETGNTRMAKSEQTVVIPEED